MTEVQTTGKVLTSLEVAEMVGKEHRHVLRDIRKIKEDLGQLKIGQSSYFTESTYKNSQNKTQPMFLLTKQGCELYGNRMTGIDGTAFAVKYIHRFNEMEQKEQQQQRALPSYQIDDDVERAMRWIQERQNFEKVALAYKKTSDERNYLAQEVISHEERLGENKNLHTVSLIAGKFGLTANKLNTILVENKIQYKKGKTYHLYAGYKDKGLAEHVAVTVSEDKVIYNLKWTEKGFHFIVRLLRSMDYTTEAPIQNFQTHFNLLSEGYTTESVEVKELSGAVSEMNKVDLNNLLTADVIELPMPTKEDK